MVIGTRDRTALCPRCSAFPSPLQLTGWSTRAAADNAEIQAGPRCFPRKDAKMGVISKGRRSCSQLSALPATFPLSQTPFPGCVSPTSCLLHSPLAAGEEAADPLPDAPACWDCWGPPPSSGCTTAQCWECDRITRAPEHGRVLLDCQERAGWGDLFQGITMASPARGRSNCLAPLAARAIEKRSSTAQTHEVFQRMGILVVL